MSYLLDDKKILLKDLVSKNANLKIENEHIVLENETFLCLINKYEEKKKTIRILEYIHCICTTLYNHELHLNYDTHHKDFLKELTDFLNTTISTYEEVFKALMKEEQYQSIKLENLQRKEKDIDELGSVYQNEIILKNNIFSIDMEKKLIQSHTSIDTKETEIEAIEEKEEIDNMNKEEMIEKQQSFDENGLEEEIKPDSKNLLNEKKISIYWSKQPTNEDFYVIQNFTPKEYKNKTRLNLKEKQQLMMNEIEKLRNEIKTITLYFENAQILINSLICQSKIFLFDLEAETKEYITQKEKIRSDKYLIKKSNTINDFYNGILTKQKKKMEDIQKTNETLLKLYKKKFENINYIISINENINNVDFLYLNVLIHNKKLNYDRLMKEYEKNYACLRSLLNDISNVDKNIKENEKKEKEITDNIEKNNKMLENMNQLIVQIANEIDLTKNISNKIDEEDNVDMLDNYSVMECIQLNKDIVNIEKKIATYKRKLQTIKNLKAKK